jgi:hypothetical protein
MELWDPEVNRRGKMGAHASAGNTKNTTTQKEERTLMDENKILMEKFHKKGTITYRVANVDIQQGYYFIDIIEAATLAQKWSKECHQNYPDEPAPVFTLEIMDPERQILAIFRNGKQLVKEEWTGREIEVNIVDSEDKGTAGPTLS